MKMFSQGFALTTALFAFYVGLTSLEAGCFVMSDGTIRVWLALSVVIGYIFSVGE
jgi:hypothetical protein